MIPNNLRARWAEGQAVINGWLSIANPFSAEIMAAQGYDSITIDTQHGVVGYADAVTMLQAMRASGVTPMARVSWLDPGALMKLLDAGAYGVICPMINTRDDAERLASYVRYPPRGQRSFGPTRANFSTGGGYAAAANDEILCWAMIETAAAVDNVDAIATTPGIDGLYIGPADLTLGMTNGRLAPGFDRTEPEMINTIKAIAAAAKAAGIRVGLHCGTPEYAARAIGWGFDLVTVSNDVRMLAGAAAAAVAKTRQLVGEAGAAPADSGSGY